MFLSLCRRPLSLRRAKQFPVFNQQYSISSKLSLSREYSSVATSGPSLSVIRKSQEEFEQKFVENLNKTSLPDQTREAKKGESVEVKITKNITAHVNEYWYLSQEELDQYLPEGAAGVQAKEWDQISGFGFLVRKKSKTIFELLEKQREKQFLNPSIVIDGPKGSGKSAFLNQLVVWARLNGWIVCFLKGSELASADPLEPSVERIGFFDQYSQGSRFCKNMQLAHGAQLGNLNCSLPETLQFARRYIHISDDLYQGQRLRREDLASDLIAGDGKFTDRNLRGLYEDELKELNRKSEFTAEELQNKRNLEFIIAAYNHMNEVTKLEDEGKADEQPLTLLQLIESGISRPEISCDVAHHFRRELDFVTEHPVLIVMDDINVCYGKSLFCDMLAPGDFPPVLLSERISLINSFSNLNPAMAGGMIVGAVTRSVPSPDSLWKQVNKNNLFHLSKFSFSETHAYLKHLKRNELVTFDISIPLAEYIHTVCNGNSVEMFNYAQRY